LALCGPPLPPFSLPPFVLDPVSLRRSLTLFPACRRAGSPPWLLLFPLELGFPHTKSLSPALFTCCCVYPPPFLYDFYLSNPILPGVNCVPRPVQLYFLSRDLIARPCAGTPLFPSQLPPCTFFPPPRIVGLSVALVLRRCSSLGSHLLDFSLLEGLFVLNFFCRLHVVFLCPVQPPFFLSFSVSLPQSFSE